MNTRSTKKTVGQTKRKLSLNSSEVNLTIKRKKQKINNEVKSEAVIETAKKVKRKKITQLTTSAPNKNAGKSSAGQESSDDQLPLAEIAKRKNMASSIHKNLPAESKVKKHSSSSPVKKPVEGKVKIVKAAFKNSISNSKSKVVKEVRKKIIEATVESKNLSDLHPTSDDGKVPVKSKAPLAKKRGKTSKVDKAVEGHHSVKHVGSSPLKTKSVTPEKKKVIEQAALEDSDGNESEMDWEDVAGI